MMLPRWQEEILPPGSSTAWAARCATGYSDSPTSSTRDYLVRGI